MPLTLKEQAELQELRDKYAVDTPIVDPITLTPREEVEKSEQFVDLAMDNPELEPIEVKQYQPEIAQNEVVVGEGENEYTFTDVMKDLKRWDKAVQVLGPIGATYDIGKSGRAVNSMKIANAKVGDYVEISLLQPFRYDRSK